MHLPEITGLGDGGYRIVSTVGKGIGVRHTVTDFTRGEAQTFRLSQAKGAGPPIPRGGELPDLDYRVEV